MLNKFFKLDENNTDLKTEFLAGLTTFLAMAYILGVNPALLSQGGMPATGVFFATAVASGISCIIMGLISKYPVGLAPGMGIIPVFVYTIIISMGNTWETALAAVFVSSILFLLITISGLREAILNAIPFDLKLAIGAGIGFKICRFKRCRDYCRQSFYFSGNGQYFICPCTFSSYWHHAYFNIIP